MSYTVIVKMNSPELKNDVQIETKQFIADEPISLGGADAGPAPFEWVMTGLGACTNMTLYMYSKRKNIDLIKVITEVSIEDDLTAPSKKKLFRKIHLEGNLSKEEIEKLLEIAKKCPVHKLLSNGNTIEDSLV